MKFAIGLLIGMIAPAPGQAQGEFKAKPRELYIGYSVGGGYDIYARLLARHMGRHLPGNPVVMPKNMEGASSLLLSNVPVQAAPRRTPALGDRTPRTAFRSPPPAP